jgi:epoxide hydrolase
MPLAWAKGRMNLVDVARMPRGGHFAAVQVPDVFVSELRRFFRNYRL